MNKLYQWFLKKRRYLKVGRRDPIANSLTNAIFRPQIVKSKKVYNRKEKKKDIVDNLRNDGII
tara:strand:- start:519 stop:707 length:189 start_codon:yes stop_codon:yes gene_type:complete